RPHNLGVLCSPSFRLLLVEDHSYHNSLTLLVNGTAGWGAAFSNLPSWERPSPPAHGAQRKDSPLPSAGTRPSAGPSGRGAPPCVCSPSGLAPPHPRPLSPGVAV